MSEAEISVSPSAETKVETKAEIPSTGTTQPEVKTEPLVPEVLTFETFKDLLPEGTTLEAASSDPHLKSFVDLMNDGKLSPKDRATELYKLQGEVLKAVSEKGAKDFEDTKAKWLEQTQKDPELTSVKLEPMLSDIAKVIDKYGSAEVREVLDYSGLGNHPALIKMLHKISRDLNEPGADTIPVRPAVPARTHAEILYPNQGKQ